MVIPVAIGSGSELRSLLTGDPALIDSWIARLHIGRVGLHSFVIVLGAGIYGSVMGWWCGLEQALYTGIKLPLVILLTSLGNALLNGMLAPLLGLNLQWRQSLFAVLMSFSIAAMILGSFGPVLLFLTFNLPSDPLAYGAWRFMQLAHVLLISLAGIMANVSLYPMLRRWSRSAVAARKVLFAWLAGNLFLGSQICWVLRPFIGRPGDNPAFVGPEPFRGSLYETVFEAVRHLISAQQ